MDVGAHHSSCAPRISFARSEKFGIGSEKNGNAFGSTADAIVVVDVMIVEVMEAALGHAYAVAGRRVEAQRTIERLKAAAESRYISPYSIAVIYLGLGDKEQAFAWLNRAYQERDNWLIYLNVEPRLDPLRSDARFAALLRRVGLLP